MKRLALVLVLVVFVAGCGRAAGPTPQVATLQTDAPLVAAFNAASSQPRILLIISPT